MVSCGEAFTEVFSALWLDGGHFFFCFFGKRECSTWTRGHLLKAWGMRSRWLSDFRASLWLPWFHQDVVFLVTASSTLPTNTQRQTGSLCLYPGPIKDRGCSWERQNKAIFYNNYSGWARKLPRRKILSHWWKGDLWLGSSKAWQVFLLIKK